MADDFRVLITPTVRFSHCHLVEARPYMEDGKPKGDAQFSVEMIIDKDDLEHFKEWNDSKEDFTDVDIRRVLAEVAKQNWPDMNVAEVVKHGGLSWPIKDGDAEAERRNGDNEALKGKKLIRIKTSEKVAAPSLYYYEGGKRKSIARGTDDGDRRAKQLFQSGNYGYFEIVVKAGTSGMNKYVTCYLGSACYVKDGERIGSPRLMDRFDGVVGGASDHDPTAGLDNDIPL